MQIIKNPSYDDIKKASRALIDGHLVAFPTETVYGLGADATNARAISQIYDVKGRPTNHPLIVHISSINQLGKWAVDIPDYAIGLANQFWPGPMTLILKRSELAKDFITGGQSNVGLRVPNQDITQKILIEFEKLGGEGIAAPSANRFGSISPTNALAVEEELGDRLNQSDLIIDSGQSLIGVESTIISCLEDSPTILRPGAVTIDMIEKYYLTKASKVQQSIIHHSGSLKSHYAPIAKVVLDRVPKSGEGFIALNKFKTPLGVVRLASPDTESEFAQILYLALRMADKKKLSVIVVWQPEGEGMAEAIRDRLKRASSEASFE
jgi:L-threonylcarbamoyladenylate synthase